MARNKGIGAFFNSKQGIFLALMGPAQFLIWFIAIVPFILEIYLSLTPWSPRSGVDLFSTQLNGGINYLQLALDPRYLAALLRTALFTFSAIAIEFVLGLALAVLVDREFKGFTLAFILLILPMMFMPVVVGVNFYMLFQPSGPVNYFISLLTGSNFTLEWTQKEITLFFTALFTDVWHWTPFMFLILLVGIRSVSPNVIDAAKTLGARGWRLFKDIKLPLMKNVIIIALVIRAIESTKLFDELIMFAAGRTNYVFENISLWAFLTNSQLTLVGYAAAGSLLIMILIIIITTYIVIPALTRR